MVKIKQLRKTQPKIRTLKKKVWKLFSEYIRLRGCIESTGLKDYGNCFTCGRIVPRKLLQAGHFISGRHNANLFSEKGVQIQCYNCNINLKGNTLEYRRRLIKKYGIGIDEELEKIDREIKKFTIPDLLELEIELKKKLELLDKTK
jgi:hypothetical protein